MPLKKKSLTVEEKKNKVQERNRKQNSDRASRIGLDPAEHEALLAESELQKKNKRDTQRSDDYAAYEASLDERNRK